MNCCPNGIRQHLLIAMYPLCSASWRQGEGRGLGSFKQDSSAVESFWLVPILIIKFYLALSLSKSIQEVQECSIRH